MVGALVGREQEFAALRAAFSRDERPLAVTIRGETGVGKTTLWQAGLDLLRAEGCQVLVTRPTPAEASLPHAALVDLFDDVVRDVELGELPGPQRAALEVVLLRRSSPEPVEDLAVASGTLRLLELLATRRPVVVALDDAQWIDPESARVLAFALRRLGHADVTCLSTVRSPHSSTLAPDHAGAVEELLLDGLGLDDLAQVVELHLDHRLLLPALVRLRRLSGGNPLAAIELARLAESRGMDLADGVTVPVPERIDNLLRSRLLALPDPVRRLLLVAALAGAPDVELLERVGAAGPDVPTLLRDAERSSVIRLDAQQVRFTHPLLSHVVTELATPTERRATHRALAEVVEDEGVRARHLAAATLDADAAVARIVADGAAAAARQAAPSSAGALYEEAVRLTPAADTGERALRTAHGVRCWLSAGHPRRAMALGRRVAAELPPSVHRGRLLLELADAVMLAESAGAGTALLEQAVEEVRGDDRATAVALRTLAWERTVAGELRNGLALVAAALEAAERSGDPVELATTLAVAAMLRFQNGSPDAAGLLERAVDVMPADADASVWRGVERERAMMAVWADDPAAGQLVAARKDEAAHAGDIDAASYWEWFEVLLEFRQGDLPQAVERIHRLQHGAEALGFDGEREGDLWLRSLLDAHLGLEADARRHAHAAISKARRTGALAFELWSEGVLGMLDLSLGAHELAADRLWSLERRCEDLGYDEPGHLRHLADAVEALTMSGRLVDAEHLAARLDDIAERTGNLWARGASRRCQALVVAADGNVDAALPLIEAAVTDHAELGQPFELARTLLVLGAVARRARQRGRAREALEQASQLFEELPAPLWRERAEKELARVGGGEAAGWELTPAEQRIAELVARGRTNREVADELFLSAKTVEWNLSKVYRKLQVRSRSELASTWGEHVSSTFDSGGSPGSGGSGPS